MSRSHNPTVYITANAIWLLDRIEAELINCNTFVTVLEMVSRVEATRPLVSGYLNELRRTKRATCVSVENTPERRWGKYTEDARPIGEGLPIIRVYRASECKPAAERDPLFLAMHKNIRAA